MQYYNGSKTIGVEPHDAEWEKMWHGLYSKFSDHKCENTGETWQYMGTWIVDGYWVHQFRHRSYFGERKYFNVQPSTDCLSKIPQLIKDAE